MGFPQVARLEQEAARLGEQIQAEVAVADQTAGELAKTSAQLVGMSQREVL